MRTDRGNEFAGSFAAMLLANNVRHVKTRPHAPWTNGRAERMVGTVKGCIRRVMHEYGGEDWQLLLPYLCNAINACCARSTHLSPSEVFLGEPGRPLVHQFDEVVGGKLAEASPEVITRFGKWVKEKLAAMKARAKATEDQYLKAGEKQYGKTLVRDGVKTAKPVALVVGQLIMVKTP